MGRSRSNDVAVVTGATSGIGAATAERLAAAGMPVVIAGRRVDAGEEVVRHIEQEAGEACFVPCDVSSESEVKGLFEEVLSRYGRLTIGVNNAGVTTETVALEQSDTALFEQMQLTNVMGVYWCMKAQIAHMLATGGGAIVNVASVSGLDGTQWAAPYTATKHAVVGLTKGAALDYAGSGIRINAVAPGPVRTAAVEHAFELGQYQESMIKDMVPMGRMADPSEIATGIAWLASAEASFVTGAVLSVDGGMHAR